MSELATQLRDKRTRESDAIHPRVRAAMLARGHRSLRSLAEAISRPQMSVHRALCGGSMPSVELALLIADELSLSLKDMREIFLREAVGTKLTGCGKVSSADEVKTLDLVSTLSVA